MEGTLFILLIFASLAQCCYDPILEVDYQLSKKDAATLFKIMVKQKLSRTRCADGLETLLDAISGLNNGAGEFCCKIAKALAEFKDSVDLAFNASLLTGRGKSCSAAVKRGRKAAYANLEKIFERIVTASKLARSGLYPSHRAAIESHSAVAQENWRNVISIDYDLIKICLRVKDAVALNEMKKARKKTLDNANHMINAIFNTIKVYAAAAPVVCQNVTFALEMQDFKDKILSSLKHGVEYKVGTRQSLYINSRLNQCGILPGVVFNQYMGIVSFLNYLEADQDIFDVATDYLRRIDLGLQDDGNDAFSRINATFAKVVATCDAGDGVILDFLEFIHPSLSSVIAKVRPSLHDANIQGNLDFFNAYHVAGTQCTNRSQILDYIETLRRSSVYVDPAYTQHLFDLIRNNLFFDSNTEAALKILQKQTFDGAVTSTYKFFDAAIVVLNARCSGVVTENDYAAIRTLLRQANTELQRFTQPIAAAGLLVYRKITKC